MTISYACWDSGQAEKLKQVAAEFEEANPGIRIDIQVNGWNDYWTALEAAATGGSLPDTFWMHSNNIYYYAANDQLLDLTDYIAQSSEVDLAKYPGGLKDIYSPDGKQYAIPKDYDTIALWYNKTLFDEAGISYPDAKTIEGVEEYFSYVKEGLSPEIYDDQARAEAIQNGQCAMGLFGSWNLSGFAENEFMSQIFDCAILPSSNDGNRATIFNGLGILRQYLSSHGASDS